MNCTTIRQGTDCVFMSRGGCGFNGGQCYTVVEQCEGCKYVVEFPTGKFCQVSPDPAGKWAFGACNLASHLGKKQADAGRKVNPLKASKRSRKG
ncbi:MAG: PxxKW family cysteine-rich protein [Nitrospinota bacterium]